MKKLLFAALTATVLSGCAVVPYGPPVESGPYYAPPPAVYAPAPVYVAPPPIFFGFRGGYGGYGHGRGYGGGYGHHHGHW